MFWVENVFYLVMKSHLWVENIKLWCARGWNGNEVSLCSLAVAFFSVFSCEGNQPLSWVLVCSVFMCVLIGFGVLFSALSSHNLTSLLIFFSLLLLIIYSPNRKNNNNLLPISLFLLLFGCIKFRKLVTSNNNFSKSNYFLYITPII